MDAATYRQLSFDEKDELLTAGSAGPGLADRDFERLVIEEGDDMLLFVAAYSHTTSVEMLQAIWDTVPKHRDHVAGNPNAPLDLMGALAITGHSEYGLFRYAERSGRPDLYEALVERHFEDATLASVWSKIA